MGVSDKPVVGISSCLLGQPVRYDGGHKQQNTIINYLSPELTLFSFCPEVSAGLGTPRPPVELISCDAGISARGRDNVSLDVTFALQKVARELTLQLQQQNAIAYIFKARSPSCGVNTTPLLNENKELLRHTDGLVAEYIRQQLPNLIIVDENLLATQRQCELFLASCKLATLRLNIKITSNQWQQSCQALCNDKNIAELTLPIGDGSWQQLLEKSIYPALLPK